MGEIILEVKRNDMAILVEALNAFGAAQVEVGTPQAIRKAKKLARLAQTAKAAQQEPLPLAPEQKSLVLEWLSHQNTKATIERFVRREQCGKGAEHTADLDWRIGFLSRAWRSMIYQRCDATQGGQPCKST